MKKSTKFLLICLLLLSLCLAPVLGGCADNAVNSAPLGSESGEIKTEYFVGETFEMSDTITWEGEELDATAYIVYPNGAKYRQKSVLFEEAGLYTVRYEAQKSGKKVVKEHELTVRRRNFYFTSSSYLRSKAYYGKDTSKYDTGHTGLTVQLYNNDTFYYDDIIDLRKTDGGDFIKFFAIPETIGYFDLEGVTIRLTDIYDDGNYLDIFVRPYPQRLAPEQVPQTPEERWKYNNTYIVAGATGQMPGGLEWLANGGYELDTRGITGFPAKHSMYGYAWFKDSVGDDILNFGLDLTEKQLYSTNVIAGRSNLVIDFDDIAYMDIPWDGFTTGEVKMSIKGTMYRKNEIPFTFMITELGESDIKNAVVIDNDAPVITLGEDEADTCFVNAKMPVPKVKVADALSKVVKEEVSVYYNYGSNTAYAIDFDGEYFIPTKEGKYTVEYKVKDSFFNTAIKTVTYDAVVGEPEPFAVTLNANDIKIKAGETHTLTLPSASGDYKKINTYIVFGDEKKQINENEYKFTARGEYQVLYEVSNAYGEVKSVGYKVTVEDGGKVVFESEPTVPKYLISGFDYELDDVYATDYNGESVTLIKAVTSIDYGNGYTFANNGKYTIPSGVESAKIRYSASNSYGTESVYYEVPVISVTNDEGYDIEKYFVGENITPLANEDTIDINASKINKKTTFAFANYLNADNFSFTFTIDKDKNQFSSVEYILTDYKDRSVQLKFAFEKTSGTGSILRINDSDKTYALSAGFKSGTSISVSFENATCIFSTVESAVLIREDLLGNKFSGFPSGIVYLEGEMKGVEGLSSIKVSKLNQQNMNDGAIDYTRPSIHINGEYKSTYSYNQEITIFSAIPCDVLDASTSATLTLRDPDGEIVKTTDGVLLDGVPFNKEYKFVANKYGNFVVNYTATDKNNRKAPYNIIISVQDTVSPDFGAIGREVTVKKATEVKISDLVVKEEGTKMPYQVRFLTTPGGERITLARDIANLKFAESGIYEVWYYAYDDNGNAGSEFIRIRVTD